MPRTFTAHIVSGAYWVPDASETTVDLLAGATVVPIANPDDFYMGSHARINGVVYTYDDELIDSGEESGVASLTLDTGLATDIPEGTSVESWNANARDGAGDVNGEWKVQVAPDGDASPEGHPATLADSLIPTSSGTMPLRVGGAVTVEAEDDGGWLVINVLGGTPGVYPEFIRTGGLGADAVVWAGTENGRRAQLDGIDGALEAFNDANEQTVNLDGVTNYIEGTLATAASGPRVEIGPGQLGSLPANEVRFDTDEVGQLTPGSVSGAAEAGAGIVRVTPPDFNGTPPELSLASAPGGTVASLQAGSVTVTADDSLTLAGSEVVIDSPAVDATMRDGSVGTGTFRDSVDARVTSVGGGAYQPLDADLTAIAALTSAADKMPYATGSGAWALADLSSFIRTLLDDTTAAAARTTLDAQQLDATLTALAGVTTAADKVIYATGSDTFTTADFTSLARTLAAISSIPTFRTTILAKDKRPGVNTQTANYQIAASDEDVRVQINSGTAKTVTLPSDTTDPAVPTNMESSVTRLGAGTVTFVADTGVTIDSRGGLLAINGQYGVVSIKKRASNRWIIWGDLA